MTRHPGQSTNRAWRSLADSITSRHFSLTKLGAPEKENRRRIDIAKDAAAVGNNSKRTIHVIVMIKF